MTYNRNSDEALGKAIPVYGEDAQRPSAAGCSLPTLSQAIAWAHVRQHALQEIQEKYPDHPAAVIAGKAMCIGPDSTGLASMASAAMERQ